VALIDEFSVCGGAMPGIVRRPIIEPTQFRTYAVVNADEPLSIFAERLIDGLRSEMRQAVQHRPQP